MAWVFSNLRDVKSKAIDINKLCRLVYIEEKIRKNLTKKAKDAKVKHVAKKCPHCGG